MERKELVALIHKINALTQSLGQIRQALEGELNTIPTKRAPLRRSSSSTTVSDEKLSRSYLELRQRFREAGPRSVAEFTKGRTTSYLDRFISVNKLPIPTKRSKSDTVEALVNYLALSRLIRGE